MSQLTTFREEVRQHLTSQLLPFWITRMPDDERGGFYGRISGMGATDASADKGVVLNTRILWTFSAAYRLIHEPEYLRMAQRAKAYIESYFADPLYGGLYWSVDSEGAPRETKKQIYALGFGIYAFSEYYRATADPTALDQAIALFRSVERYSFDPLRNGYFEAFTRQWNEIEDMRLSAKDDNSQKTMNTHLHLLEPYTNLYRVWKDETLRRKLHNMITLFLDKFLDQRTSHLHLFFDADWKNQRHIVSYGHDIEASWLLHEAALELGDESLLRRVESVVPSIVRAAEEGVLPDGSMMYERDNSTHHTDADRHWWVQAEALVGYLNLYQHQHDDDSLRRMLALWDYIKAKLINTHSGEWHWSVFADGTINTNDDLAGLWKCPYHNSRMCLEVIERLKTV